MRQVTTITAGRTGTLQRLGEVPRYRDVLHVLAFRSLRVRYRQSVLGAGWAIVQPLAATVVFTAVFSGVADFSVPGVPYAVLVLAALIPWTIFAATVTNAAGSLVNNQQLFTKVYFPRLLIPAAASAVPAVDAAVATAGLVIVGTLADLTWTPRALLFPSALALAWLLALGLGIGLAALAAQFRDARIMVPFLLQILFFATPVAYPNSALDATAAGRFLALNPLAGIIQYARWTVGVQPDIDLSRLFIAAALTLAVLVGGLRYFHRVEPRLADVI